MATKEIPAHHQWANNLKPGDNVFVSSYVLSRQELVKKEVVKVTPIRIFVGEHKSEFKRATLSRKTGSYSWEHLLPVTQENERILQHNQLSDKIQYLAHDVNSTKTKRSTIEVMTIEELLVLQGAMETVCGLLDEAAKRVTK